MQPHDRLFRAVFSEPEHAEGLLRVALPSALAQQIDWTTLRPLRAGLVDSALQARYADVLFSVQLAGRPAILHLLVEHQSKPDRLMPLRLLGYMLRIWERLLGSKSAELPLPAIIPIVCHHSK
ncbi:MAG: Rpn family recombination-promoting nuclease/putative transposase, partial [Polyangiaceae bacterium]|nr:Rpn family recombination-promoting nuclease/putative transposase [Polyangiaceae bacterium]